MKKAIHLKAGGLLDYQVLFLLLNEPQIEYCLHFNRSISMESIDFMTSEDSDTLILPFTSKTGQSVAQNREKIFFICVLLVNRGHI